MSRAPTVFVALALLLPVAYCSGITTHLHGSTSPLILWSNRGVIGPDQGSQVLYEVLEDVEKVAGSIVLGALGKAAEASHTAAVDKLLKLEQLTADQHNSAIIIYAGSQIDAAALRKPGPSSKLASLLDSASSSMVVPHASFMGESLQDSLTKVLNEASISFKTVGCSEESEDLGGDVARALVQDSGKLQVVLVCPRVSSEMDQTPAGINAELEQLLAVQEAMEASDISHMFVYASQSSAAAASHSRSLLQRRTRPSPPPRPPPGYYGFGQYKACGPLCQTQVRWLEGLLAIIFLALASCAGLTCLLVLNTPTRFEVVKDGSA